MFAKIKKFLQSLVEEELKRTRPCKHENVQQGWFIQGILERECLDCKKRETWNTFGRFNKLWNPKLINDKPIHGIDLEKMQYHKQWLDKGKPQF